MRLTHNDNFKCDHCPIYSGFQTTVNFKLSTSVCHCHVLSAQVTSLSVLLASRHSPSARAAQQAFAVKVTWKKSLRINSLIYCLPTGVYCFLSHIQPINTTSVYFSLWGMKQSELSVCLQDVCVRACVCVTVIAVAQ